jgi:hypothetical protein
LQKIGRYSFGSRLESEHAPDAAHLFFSNGITEPFCGVLATHPPIPERIRAIDPSWDGHFPPLDEKQIQVVQQAALDTLKRPATPNLFGTVVGGAILAEAGAPAPPAIRSHVILPNLGNPTPLHLRYAEELRGSLPDSVTAAAREPLNAVALVYALLLSSDEAQRAAQLAGLAQRVEPAMQQSILALFPDVSASAAHARLPMLNLVLGALRHLSTTQFDQFSQTLQWLVESEAQMDLFEFVLQKIVRRYLAAQLGRARPPVIQFYSAKALVPDCAVVLSALAHLGSDDPAAAANAFGEGAPYFRAPDREMSLLPPANCELARVDAALDRLAQAAPQIKKNLLEASVRVVGADGLITEREAELLRAVADTLDCPIPPFVQVEGNPILADA